MKIRTAVIITATAALALAVFAQQQPPQGQPGRGGRGGGGRGAPVGPLEESGFRPIFDGTLKNWDGDTDFWKIVNGVMIGETTTEHQPKQNIFIIYRGSQPGDFELKLDYKLSGADTGNSGIQYRSEELPEVARWVLKGYQADIDARQTYTGQIYEERGRGFLALRGMFSYVGDGKKVGSISSLGDGEELKKFIKQDDFNEIHIVAKGNFIVQSINGHVMSMLLDDDRVGRRMGGLIGIQLHRTPGPLKIEAKNIRLKDL
jgi:3-keto-disaccharide hydrolase